jgi:hypothetical protein
MSDELKDNIRGLINYYEHHGVGQMIETHPGFVADDFSKLLEDLGKELDQ